MTGLAPGGTVWLTGIAGAQPRAQTVVLLGDSITAQNTNQGGVYDAPSVGEPTNYYFDGQGFFSWANVALGHRLLLLRNSGVGGQRTDQMLARLATDVLAYAPKWCIVEGGVNDVAQGVASSVIIANLTAIYAGLQAAGIVVVATTITPTVNATTVAMQTALSDVNAWMRAYVAANPSIVLCDWYSVMADGPNAPKTGLTKDGVHPTPDGAAAMGAVLATTMSAISTAQDTLIVTGSETNLLTNGLMIGGTTLATSWSQSWGGAAGTYVGSKVARSDGKPGEWQQIQLTSAGTLQFFQQNTNVGVAFNIGDRIQAEVEFQTDNDFAAVSQFSLNVFPFGGAGQSADLYHRSGDAAAAQRIAAGVLRTPVLVVPPSANRLQFIIRFYGTGGTARFSRARMWKV